METLFNRFDLVAAAISNRPAVVCDAEAVRYGDLGARAGRVGTGLVERGIRHGRRVAFTLANSPDAVAVMLAVNALGSTFTALDPRAPAPRLHATMSAGDVADDCEIHRTGCCFTSMPKRSRTMVSIEAGM